MKQSSIRDSTQVLLVGSCEKVVDINPVLVSLFDEVISLSTPCLSQKEDLLSFMIQEKIFNGDIEIDVSAADFDQLNCFLVNMIPSLSSKSTYSSLSYLELCYQYDNDLNQLIQRGLLSCNDQDPWFHSLFSSESKQIDEHFIGHSDLKQQILNTLIYPRKYSNLYSQFRLPSTHGLLLYGPPGTGKTYLISLIAQHLNYSFLNVKLSSVICGEIGSSEQKIRNIFADAKRSIPCIVFIDEFQALFPSNDHQSSTSNSSLLITLAGCIDEIQLYNQYSSDNKRNGSENNNSSNIIIIAATNEPWRVDKSFLRSGRFDQILYVGLMNDLDRSQLISKLLQNLLKKNSFLSVHEEDKIVLEEMCGEMKSYTAADICYIFQRIEAMLIQELMNVAPQNNGSDCEYYFVQITKSHFQKVLKDSIPSCTTEEVEEYLQWQREMKLV